MRLFIAEKPNMGKAIAQHLPGPHVRKNGYIETQGGIVTWCVGHILEQAPPEAYDEKYKQWNLADLPMTPAAWQMQVSSSKADQVKIIRQLLKQCTEVVNAGDPGREGQLIVDEVLEFLSNTKPVLRILLNALDPTSVKNALNALVDNKQFFPLYQAALGRQRADWLVGMNLTRAYTILGKRQGYQGVLSVGRVQSPTLAIVVRRDLEIEAFQPLSYWSLQAQFQDSAQHDSPFWARWLPPGVTLDAGLADAPDEEQEEGDEPEQEDEDAPDAATGAAAGGPQAAPRPSWVDSAGRILEAQQAHRIAAAVKAAGQGQVVQYQKKPAQELPPMPYELTGLQAKINAMTGASVKDVLDACQKLYEQGYASYPRTDSPFLPESQHADAPAIFQALAAIDPQFQTWVQLADPSLRSKAFNSSKVGEHHAIIPTRVAPDLSQLPPLERKVYEVIVRQYMAQFYPPCLVDKASVEIACAQERFAAKGRVITDPGWRMLFGKEAPAGAAGAAGKKLPTPEMQLPVMKVNDVLPVKDVKVDANTTKPPPHFTQGTLLKAMKHVDRLVSDPVERKKLKAVEGIGRSATRAGIIETLIKRTFLHPQAKKLVSSGAARVLVGHLPTHLTDPGLTARWETVLDAIATQKVALAVFEQRQVAWVAQLLQQVLQTPLPPLPDLGPPARSTGGGKSSGTRTTSSKGKAATTRKPSSSSGKSSSSSPPAGGGTTCPKCNKGVMRDRTVKNGAKAGQTFQGCSNYPECNHTIWPK